MMNLTTRLAFATLLLSGAGCAPEPCTVADNGDGSFTLSCPDGTSATVADGADGTNGTDGTNGGDGTNGDDGVSWLIRTDIEDPGENCDAGGLAVHTGPDTNANDTLDEGEIAATEYVCDGADGNQVHGHIAFPSPTSSLFNNSFTTPLGYGGSSGIYEDGSYVEQTYEQVGFDSISALTYAFVMYDGTIAGCDDDVRDFAIFINGREVGTYSFTGGTAGNIAFTDSLEFAAVSGGGTSGQRYTLRIEALDTVCSGNSSYNWYAGGQFIVSP